MEPTPWGPRVTSAPPYHWCSAYITNLGQFNQFNTLNKPLLLILFQIKHLRWILWE